MRKRNYLFISLIIALLTAGVIGLTRHTQASAVALPPLLVEHDIPLANARPLNIAVADDGTVWFTMPERNQIGRLVVNAGVPTFTAFSVPTANSFPYDLVVGVDSVWFTERDGNKIGRFVITTETFSEYTIPTANSKPLGITLDRRGDVWFAESNMPKIGVFKVGATSFTEFTAPGSSIVFGDIAVSPGDLISIASTGNNSVYQFDINRQQFGRIPLNQLGQPSKTPGGIALDTRGEPWAALPNDAQIARSNPGTLTLWEFFNVSPGNAQPEQLVYQRADGLDVLWYTDRRGNVGRLIADATKPSNVAYIPLPDANSQPFGIAQGGDGTLWIADRGANSVVEWRQPYLFRLMLPVVER